MTKEFLGYVSTSCAALGYGLYIISIFRGKTHPHLFSWLIWGIVTAIVFFAQYSRDGGAGAWATGFSSVVSLFVAALALRYGEKKISTFDWLALSGALAAIPIWYLTKDPLASVILETLIDQLGFYPTFRKSYYKPHEESSSTYIMDIFKYLFSLLAMASYSWTTVFFPTIVILSNSAFLLMQSDSVRRLAAERLRSDKNKKGNS